MYGYGDFNTYNAEEALDNVRWNTELLQERHDNIKDIISKCMTDLQDMTVLSCKLENGQTGIDYAVKRIDHIRKILKIHLDKLTEANSEARDILFDLMTEKYGIKKDDYYGY